MFNGGEANGVRGNADAIIGNVVGAAGIPDEKSDDPALTFGRYYKLSGVPNIGLKINVFIEINSKCRYQCVVKY